MVHGRWSRAIQNLREDMGRKVVGARRTHAVDALAGEKPDFARTVLREITHAELWPGRPISGSANAKRTKHIQVPLCGPDHRRRGVTRFNKGGNCKWWRHRWNYFRRVRHNRHNDEVPTVWSVNHQARVVAPTPQVR